MVKTSRKELDWLDLAIGTEGNLVNDKGERVSVEGLVDYYYYIILSLIYLLGPESGIRGLQNRLVEDKYKQTFNIEIQKISRY